MLMEAEEMGLLRMGDRLLERNGWADFRAVPHIRTFLGQRRGRRSGGEVGLDQASAAAPASLTRPVTRCPRSRKSPLSPVFRKETLKWS